FRRDGLEQRHGHRPIARRAPSDCGTAAAAIVEPRLSIRTASDPWLIRLNGLSWNAATSRSFPGRWAAGQRAQGLILVPNGCARGDCVIAPPRCDWSSRVAPRPTANPARCRAARLRRRGRSGGKSRTGGVGREAPVGLDPGTVFELGELPRRARPRAAVGGGSGIGSPPVAVEDNLVKDPLQGEAEFAAVRPGRGRALPRSLRKARGGLWEARFAVHELLSSLSNLTRERVP